jgi:hypothetical protein
MYQGKEAHQEIMERQELQSQQDMKERQELQSQQDMKEKLAILDIKVCLYKYNENAQQILDHPF